jgi:hypothetical protein
MVNRTSVILCVWKPRNVDRLDLSRFILVFRWRKSMTYDFEMAHWFNSLGYGFSYTGRLWKGI